MVAWNIVLSRARMKCGAGWPRYRRTLLKYNIVIHLYNILLKLPVGRYINIGFRIIVVGILGRGVNNGGGRLRERRDGRGESE